MISMRKLDTRTIRRMLGGTLAAAALLLMAPQVRAQATQTQIHSDINGNFDFKLGPYYPNIDEEFSADEGPFESSFGPDNRIMGQISAEYYLWQGHGKFGVGGTVGYTRFNGSADIQGGDSNGGGSDGGGGDSGNDSLNLSEDARFTVFPLGVITAYRWDFLVQQWNIPIAPKVEGGLDYYLWKMADGSGNVPTVDGNRAAGGTPGFHLTGRIEFLLDWIDPQSAANFDLSWGINNTYLFAEYTISRVQDLDGSGFRLGDNSWRAGLAFEF